MFVDVEELVWMAYIFYIMFVDKVKFLFEVIVVDQFIKNDVVENLVNLYFVAFFEVEYFFVFYFDFRYINGFNVNYVFGCDKVDFGDLFVWFYFQQDDFFWVVVVNDDLLQFFEVCFRSQFVKEVRVVFWYVINFLVFMGY